MNLVIGATGLLGSTIVRQLCAAGRPVRALVRATSDPAKVRALEAAGAETAIGDLKEPDTLNQAMAGVTHVVSTASSTISRATGDTIESVDRSGQLSAIAAARRAGVRRFVFVSFPDSRIDFPLQDAKRAVEAALRDSGLPHTVLQPLNFWEVWLSPALGFDAHHRTARVFGDGDAKVSWVSLLDVAETAVRAVDHPGALNQVFSFGGPEALTTVEVVRLFEAATGGAFQIDRVPLGALEAELQSGADPLARSFAGLALSMASGEWIHDHRSVRDVFGMEFRSIRDYARQFAPPSAT
jgi:NADH dehydrogenase